MIVHHVLKKRNQIFSMVRKCSAQYIKRTHTFGPKLSKIVNEAYTIDEKNGNTIWQHDIQKEIENVKIAFQTIPEGKKPSNGFQYVNCHMVFNIKMENFQRTAYQVARGPMNLTTETITYSSLVTKETVCITLTIVVLHDLEVKAADVLNAYVMAPNHENIWTVLGPSF